MSLPTRQQCQQCLLCWVVWIVTYIDRVPATENYQNPRNYVLNLTQTSWQDAAQICSDNGGILATLYDLSTIPDLHLQDSLAETDESMVWVGLSKADNGSWYWEGGDGVTYQNWRAGGSSEEGCVAATFNQPYDWSVKPCDVRLPFLCQYQGGECRFEVQHNASIAAHNYMYLYQRTALECQAVCNTTSAFTCQSFEYDSASRRCQFNSGNKWTLAPYFSIHQGWDYYHRTCNSGKVIGELLDLTSYISSSSPTMSSTSSIYISPTPTAMPETSSIDIQCSEMFVTKDILVTHDIYKTHDVTVTHDVTATKDVFITQDVHVTRDLFVTNSVVLSTTVTETAIVTTTQISTTTVTLTPSPVLFFPSESVYEDPVEELLELETEIKEKAKSKSKISIMDDRPSATYVGYFAILFLSLIFGSIVLFDMLTIFQSGLCKRCMKFCKGKHNRSRGGSVRKADTSAGGIANDSFVWSETGEQCIEEQYSPNVNSGARLWRKTHWAVGDSGFGGSNSDANTSDVDSRSDRQSVKDHTEVVTIEIQDSDSARGNISPETSDITTSSVISTEHGGVVSDDADYNGGMTQSGSVYSGHSSPENMEESTSNCNEERTTEF